MFAYGPTGAGKTHTMVGDAAQPGIMIRALNDLFQVIKDNENEYSVSINQICVSFFVKHAQNLFIHAYLQKRFLPSHTFTFFLKRSIHHPPQLNSQVTMSYLELYNEQIRDLLNPSSGYLELREDSRGRNIQVAGLSEVSTTSTDEVSKTQYLGLCVSNMQGVN